MLKFCINAWDKNKDKLKSVIRTDTKLKFCDYSYLVKLIVKYILNPSIEDDQDKFNADEITVIDNGDYQGTLLFMIPRDTYQPTEYDYLLTYVGYGSCSGCDTLLSILDLIDELPTENQTKDLMTLCRHLVCNIVKPYNCGWKQDEDFVEITIKEYLRGE